MIPSNEPHLEDDLTGARGNMQAFLGIFLFLFLLLFSGSCKDEDPFFMELSLPAKEHSEHFTFHYDDGLTPDQVLPIIIAVEENYSPIVGHFGTSELPKIKIAIWSDRAEFDRAMNNKYPFATGYLNGREELRLFYVEKEVPRTAVHEFVHAVTMFVSNDFANNPRWLWEAIAQYESGSFVNPNTLPYMVAGNYPTMNELSNEQGSQQRIYPLGYTIGEFIVGKWGYEGLRTLVENHGDMSKSLEITEAEFDQQWQKFVEEVYL
ncbi:MAG: hypothetical protein WKF87_09660 [Chryseolinea sp.]